mmetsp:Transcript_96513/g.282090  ORF Transcript_96513/g.282090 Transcript_96513/m.282090 type:complete len:201 (+) Transcript_96513:1047-1649(+)
MLWEPGATTAVMMPVPRCWRGVASALRQPRLRVLPPPPSLCAPLHMLAYLPPGQASADTSAAAPQYLLSRLDLHWTGPVPGRQAPRATARTPPLSGARLAHSQPPPAVALQDAPETAPWTLRGHAPKGYWDWIQTPSHCPRSPWSSFSAEGPSEVATPPCMLKEHPQPGRSSPAPPPPAAGSDLARPPRPQQRLPIGHVS